MKKKIEKKEDEAMPGYTGATAEEAKKLIDNDLDLIIIDVSPFYDDGHIPGAVNYPVENGSLEAVIPDLDPEAKYLVYCHSDSVSMSGAQKLEDAGFKDIIRLLGNFQAWVDTDYEIKKKISRRGSREAAVILLYQKDLLNKETATLIKNDKLNQKFLDEFALHLINGVDRHLKEIDKFICNIVENWSIDRIAVIDRNILRVAIYEMRYDKDIPLKVSVDEAIEIAKSLGQKDDTPKFINGVLGKFLNQISQGVQNKSRKDH